MVILLIAFCICVCTLPMAHRLTTPQILLDMEDSEQESILGGLRTGVHLRRTLCRRK